VSNSGHLKWCFQEGQIEFDTPNQVLAEGYQAKAREALEIEGVMKSFPQSAIKTG